MGEARKVVRCEIQQNLDALSVLDLRAMDPGLEYQILSVHQEVALSTFDLLATVVSALFSTDTGCLDRLAIHCARAGLRISLQFEDSHLPPVVCKV